MAAVYRHRFPIDARNLLKLLRLKCSAEDRTNRFDRIGVRCGRSIDRNDREIEGYERVYERV